MGGSSTKPALPSIPLLDPSKGQYTGDYLADLQARSTAAQAVAVKAAEVASAEAQRWKWFFISVFPALGLFILVIVLIHDAIARNTGSQTWMLPGAPAATPVAPAAPTAKATTTPPTVAHFTDFLGWGNTREHLDTAQPAAPAPAPPLLWQWLNGAGTSAGPHDASTLATVPGSGAGLSSGNQGGYGMQWWMYVQDWNYGYGRDKAVVHRSDPTNPSIQNPAVSLHPTTNALKFSISVFPAGSEGGVSEPAAAGHAGSTDDVFVCEVPNIPLQTWFSVSMTVFDRNLDVYIDGKLVKSCFLNGVPKPAVGDILLTKDSGYSGLMCDYAYSPSVLMPNDAMAFFSKDTTCRAMTQASAGTAATGYAVKFGVYDTVGKKIQEYTF